MSATTSSVSVIARLFALFAAVVEELTEEQLDALVADEAATADQLRQALSVSTTTEPATPILPTPIITVVGEVTVDYAKSVEQLVKAGKYDWVNDNVTQKNFPHDQKRPAENVVIELAHFGKSVSSEDAIAWNKANGYRVATPTELLATGITFPDEQRQYPIVALGEPYWLSGGERLVLCLGGRSTDRNLFCDCFVDDWGVDYRFAVVRVTS